MVSGDRARLQQVVWNLLSNAMKFTPKGGRVQIRLERIDSHVEIIVSDNGQGIDQHTLPHIFERFRQADSTSTREHSGLGLGLALVRHLVELHGGSVEAHSEGLGQGATFTAKLPLSVVRSAHVQHPAGGEQAQPSGNRDSNSGANGSAPLGCPPELNGLHVLVVDDEKDTRLLLLKVLEKCGAHVTVAGSAQEALAAIVQSPPDVLVSDIGMPGEDGYSLINKVRAPQSRADAYRL
jgi:response regulator of citrate/malate metabolism